MRRLHNRSGMAYLLYRFRDLIHAAKADRNLATWPRLFSVRIDEHQCRVWSRTGLKQSLSTSYFLKPGCVLNDTILQLYSPGVRPNTAHRNPA